MKYMKHLKHQKGETTRNKSDIKKLKNYDVLVREQSQNQTRLNQYRIISKNKTKKETCYV